MFKNITLLSLLVAIFAFGSITGCKKKRHKRHKRNKSHKRYKKNKKQCKKLYKRIASDTKYSKRDIKKVYGDKDGFISACKENKHSGPFFKLLKCVKHNEDLSKCGKKHLNKILKNHKKDKKIKVKKIKKDTAPAKVVDGKIASAMDVGKLLYDTALKGDFVAMKKLFVTAEDVKAFDNGNIFKKFANEKKLKSKFEVWTKTFKGSVLKKVKAKDEDKVVVKPGEKPKKLEELAAAIKKEVTVWNMSVKATVGTETFKCALVTIKLGDKNWKLIRIKGCKKK
jgi:hypothetical protein